jgi:hypothetical protein
MQSLTEKLWNVIQEQQEHSSSARVDMRRLWQAVDWPVQPECFTDIFRELEELGLILTFQDEEGIQIIVSKPVWECPDCKMTVYGQWSEHLDDCLHRQRKAAEYRRHAECLNLPR